MTSDDPGPGQKYAIMASPPSERKSQESKSRSGGAQATKALKGTRWLASGPNLPLTSQMPTERSGSISGTQAAKSGRENSLSGDPWLMSSAGFGKGVGGG